MKIKNKLLSALIIASLSTATIAQEKREIEVSVESDGINTTKTVTLNGKQLGAEEIAALEANGDIRIIHVDDGHHSGFNKDIQVMIDTANGKTIKKVIINGKELTEDEIAELEASGELEALHMDSQDLDGKSFKKIMVFKSSDKSSDKHIVKMITNTISIDDDSATLGFMTSIKEDGWHVISIVEGSGAQEAGLKAGDVIKFMGDKDLTNNGGSLKDQLNMTKREVGEMVDVEFERDGKLLYLSVEARKNNSFDMVMDLDIDADHKSFSWIDDLKGVDSMVDGKHVKVMVLNGDMEKSIDFDNVDFDIPHMLSNMNIFITDGNSTSKLLGKNHEMSALSKGLESYFNTKGGVLMMHVSPDNVFGLKDGDVIKSVGGTDVNSPKDVIKQLLKADEQEKLKIKVVRHKKNKTLKYHK